MFTAYIRQKHEAAKILLMLNAMKTKHLLGVYSLVHGVCSRRMNYELALLYGEPGILMWVKLQSETEHLAELLLPGPMIFTSLGILLTVSLSKIQLTVPLSSGVRMLLLSDPIYDTYNNCLTIISTP